jgi:hypothetical protein
MFPGAFDMKYETPHTTRVRQVEEILTAKLRLQAIASVKLRWENAGGTWNGFIRSYATNTIDHYIARPTSQHIMQYHSASAVTLHPEWSKTTLGRCVKAAVKSIGELLSHCAAVAALDEICELYSESDSRVMLLRANR